MSTIRYPGSKHKMRHAILNEFPHEYIPGGLFNQNGMVYVEPFFGSGAVGWQTLSALKEGTKVFLNDKDWWLMCLWHSVKQVPDDLIDKIKCAQLAASLFSEYKKEDGNRRLDPLEAGFRKLLLHQMSFSGLGSKAGGPIGGANQNNEQYHIESRWNPVEQIASVRIRNILLNKFDAQLSCKDYKEVIDETDSESTMFYLDPPYVKKGADLYKHAFNAEDHVSLFDAVSRIKGKFVLSYDDDPLIRRLYSRFKIIETKAMYTICGERKNSELIIKNYR